MFVVGYRVNVEMQMERKGRWLSLSVASMSEAGGFRKPFEKFLRLFSVCRFFTRLWFSFLVWLVGLTRLPRSIPLQEVSSLCEPPPHSQTRCIGAGPDLCSSSKQADVGMHAESCVSREDKRRKSFSESCTPPFLLRVELRKVRPGTKEESRKS